MEDITDMSAQWDATCICYGTNNYLLQNITNCFNHVAFNTFWFESVTECTWKRK